ncbi:hypothetical protein YQE_12183, partial [Dendroctonus ponderosae]
MTIWDVEWFSQKAEQARRKTWIPWKSRKCPKRAILKDGHKNVYRKNISKIRWWRYLQDIFTTLLDAQWRWTLQFLVLEFFGCWLIFALIWWLIAFVHGDLHDDHLPLRQAETGWTPCVLNIHGFHSAFLYSIETQHTTGYGLRVITEECPEAIFVLVCQCLIGITLDSFAISIVFAKLVRAKHASHTVQFSKNAVLSHRNGKLCFMFRVGDIKKSRLAGVAVRAIVVKCERSQEGEVLQNYQTELSLKCDDGPSSIILLWPLILYHEIDENSPLYDFTVPEIMKCQKVEIIVVLNGTVESTGVSIEAKSSYLSSEILWDHKFAPIISYNKYVNCYDADWEKFDQTYALKMNHAEEDEYVLENPGATPSRTLDEIWLLQSPVLETKLLGSPDMFEAELDGQTDQIGSTSERFGAVHETSRSVDTNTYFPDYEKPSGPDCSDKGKHRANKPKYPETIRESDENYEEMHEIQVTLV